MSPANGSGGVTPPMIPKSMRIGWWPRRVELRLAVRCLSRPGPRPRLGGHAEVEVAAGGLGLELLPAPQPDEVVTPVLQELEVGVVVELFRGLGAVGARPHAVVEVVPDVRSGQVDGRAAARCDREVARVWLPRRGVQGRRQVRSGVRRGASARDRGRRPAALPGRALVVSHFGCLLSRARSGSYRSIVRRMPRSRCKRSDPAHAPQHLLVSHPSPRRKESRQTRGGPVSPGALGRLPRERKQPGRVKAYPPMVSSLGKEERPRNA